MTGKIANRVEFCVFGSKFEGRFEFDTCEKEFLWEFTKMDGIERDCDQMLEIAEAKARKAGFGFNQSEYGPVVAAFCESNPPMKRIQMKHDGFTGAFEGFAVWNTDEQEGIRAMDFGQTHIVSEAEAIRVQEIVNAFYEIANNYGN